jgi:hypothetical protein
MMPIGSKIINLAKEIAIRKVGKQSTPSSTVPGIAKVFDEFIASKSIPAIDAPKVLRNLESILVESGMDPKRADKLTQRVSEHFRGDTLSHYPYEDIDGALHYIGGFPSLGLEYETRAAQKLLRDRKMIRPGEGAEHKDLYGGKGNPYSISDTTFEKKVQDLRRRFPREEDLD